MNCYGKGQYIRETEIREQKTPRSFLIDQLQLSWRKHLQRVNNNKHVKQLWKPRLTKYKQEG